VVGEGVRALEPDARSVRHEVDPVGALRRLHRGGHQLEVLGALGVGHDQQLVATVVEVVLDAVLAGGDEPRLRLRVARLEQVPLAGHLAAHGDGDEALRPRAAHADPEALVVLAVHDLVVRRVRPEPVPADLVGAPRLVGDGVEEGRIVVEPRQRVRGILDAVG